MLYSNIGGIQGYIGIMEKKMETTRMGFYRVLGSKGHLLGLGFRVQGLGFGVSDSRFRVWGVVV